MNWKGYLGIGLGTAVVVGGGLLLWNKLRNKKVEEEPFKPDPQKEETEKKTTGVSYTAEKFPLKIYMKGDNVKKLQVALGVKADGYFGADTEKALYEKANAKTCSADLFRELTTEKTTKKVLINEGSYAPQIGVKVYANENGVKVRNSYVIASGNVLGKVSNDVLIGTADQYKTEGKYRWVRVKLAHPKEMQNKTFKDTEAPEFGWVRGDVCYYNKQ